MADEADLEVDAGRAIDRALNQGAISCAVVVELDEPGLRRVRAERALTHELERLIIAPALHCVDG